MIWTRRCALAVAIVIVIATSASRADGDVTAGEKIFKTQCVTCHTIGAGEKAKTGPNLFGVYGRKPALFEGYRYSRSYALAAEKGTVWDDAALDEYLENPLAFIRKASGDAKGQSKMTYNLKKAKDRDDVIAYLKTQK